jgi:glycine/D-amino acid oxidase-like deaminating enzyme
LASAKENNIATEDLDVEAFRQRFPQFNYKNDMEGIYEPGGVFLRPEIAIDAALKDAEENGATVWEETGVRFLLRDETGEVTT